MRFCLSRFKTWLSRVFVRDPVSSFNQSELMDRLSHELRTSLTGIVGYSEFVETNSTEPMVNFTAKIIKESSQGLARASNSFFDLHRLALGQVRANCSSFSISELVRDVVRLHQPLAFEHDVHLIFTCTAESFLLDMNADAQRVRQVMDALVFGAIQSSEKVTSIHVDVAIDEDKEDALVTLIFLDLAADGTQGDLLKEFWCDEHYKFRLQEGPGIELALAKAMIHFLQGRAAYVTAPGTPPRLVVKLPIRYDQTKV